MGRWKRNGDDPFRKCYYGFHADGTGSRWTEAPGLHSDTELTWRVLGPDRVEIHFGESESSEDGEVDNRDWDETVVRTFAIEGETLTMDEDPQWPTHYTYRGPPW